MFGRKVIRCPRFFCRSKDVTILSNNTHISFTGAKSNKKQRFRCNKCGRTFTADIK